jgi:uncharacterized protein (TIRG00374 family)
MRKNWVRFGVVLLLAAVFLFFFFRSVNWKEVYRYLSDVNLPIFILTILLAPVHLVTRAIRWRYLLVPEKKDVRFWSMFAGNAVGFAVNFSLPGRVGEVAKPLYLARKENIRAGFALGTVVVERIFDMFTMCFLLGLFLLARPLYSSKFKGGVEGYNRLYLWGIVGIVFASALLLLSLALYFFKEKTLRFISFLLKPFPQKFSRRVIGLSEEFIRGLKFFRSKKYLLLYIFFSFVVWLGIIFYYWVFLFAFGVRLQYVMLIPYIFLTMVGASVPTPGMVGGFHYFSKLGLTSFYGIDPNLAVGVTILVHAVQVVVTCCIGYAILWKDGMTVFQLKKFGEVQTP